MLKQAGCKTLYVDGSFVTDKKVPKDWDGCFDASGVDWLLMDPIVANPSNQPAIQAKYRANLFRADSVEASIGLTFRQFFQQDRQGNPKGIIALDLSTVS
ncbi:MAG: hypothetical protein WDO24_20650 [Pseudomonadota bacterium]